MTITRKLPPLYLPMHDDPEYWADLGAREREAIEAAVLAYSNAGGHRSPRRRMLAAVRAFHASIMAQDAATPPPTDFEKAAQAKRCACRGADDYCKCQNVADEVTIEIRRLADNAQL